MAGSIPEEPKIRAFVGMKWMLLALVLAWIITGTASDLCGEIDVRPNWPDMIALSLVCALWAAHTHNMQHRVESLLTGERMQAAYYVFIQATYNLVILAAISAPICVLFNIASPDYNCGGQPIGNFQSLGLSVTSYTQALEEYAQQHELTALTGVPKLMGDLPQRYKDAKVSSSDNGTTFVPSAKPPGAILLVPQFKDGKLTWICNEYPHEYARPRCRVAPGMVVP
jgi:hypothetical protein